MALDSNDLTRLNGIFTRTTKSLKFSFFLALLSIVRRLPRHEREIELLEVATEMVVLAWHRAVKMGFELGEDDPAERIALRFFASKEIGITNLRERMLHKFRRGEINEDVLLRYVPFRLIRTFLANETGGIKDSLVNDAIVQEARAKFNQNKPLYMFSVDRRSIIMHPDWLEYFRTRHDDLVAWSCSSWLSYLGAGKSSRLQPKHLYPVQGGSETRLAKSSKSLPSNSMISLGKCKKVIVKLLREERGAATIPKLKERLFASLFPSSKGSEHGTILNAEALQFLFDDALSELCLEGMLERLPKNDIIVFRQKTKSSSSRSRNATLAKSVKDKKLTGVQSERRQRLLQLWQDK